MGGCLVCTIVRRGPKRFSMLIPGGPAFFAREVPLSLLRKDSISWCLGSERKTYNRAYKEVVFFGSCLEVSLICLDMFEHFF